MDSEKEESQEQKINKGIPLKKESFMSSQGLFVDVYKGHLTEIVKRFNKKGS